MKCPHDDAQELRAEYGWDRGGFYSADTFNENVPPSADPGYLRATSAAVYQVRDAKYDARRCGTGYHHR